MKRLPAFTVLLLMTALAVAGIACIPALNVQYAPSVREESITVSWSWPDVPARVVEAEVTSKVEGVLSSLGGCTGISSDSYLGRGWVTVKFRKKTDMAAARFETASAIRNLYPSLPAGVTYPNISLSTAGTRSGRPAVSFMVKSSLPSEEIRRFVESRVLGPLSTVDGVGRVSLQGATPFELEITFDAAEAAALGITAPEIASAWSEAFSTADAGFVQTGAGTANLKVQQRRTGDFGDVVIKKAGDRIVHLRDIATWQYKEAAPTSYYRLNGLNTIQINAYTEANTNLLAVAGALKGKMEELKAGFPPEITCTVSYDSSEYMAKELDKIYFRTALCILILLVFVFLVNRSWRYLLIISATLAVDILVAMALYALFGLDIHIYTLAGITVSLGIIIDTSIVMTDHYSYYRDRSVMPALIGATATTIGALVTVLLLPEQDKRNLLDFSMVIIINLTVALLTAWLFIPSLLDKYPLKRSSYSTSPRRLRRVVRWNRRYRRYIDWGRRHKWVYGVAMVAAFGIPLCVLPKEVAKDKAPEERNVFEKGYNAVMRWRPYADNRNKVDRILGTSFALFHKATERSDFYREPGRDVLYISAGMPEGNSIVQLNEVVKSMENYLAGFNEIESFSTEISSYSYATIEVRFKPEWENTGFPAELKSRATSMAMNFGGANWRVWGINDSYFNNHVVSNYKGYGIELRGYNYDRLAEYADTLLERLSHNRRAQRAEMVSSSGSVGLNEYSIDYDFAQIAALGVSPHAYYSKLYSKLYDTQLESVVIDGHSTPVRLRSSDADRFDLWHVENEQVAVDSSHSVKLAGIGSITKKRTGLSVHKEDQSYVITVGYDFLGSHELAKKLQEQEVDYMNEHVLPVGYNAAPQDRSWDSGKKSRYAWLIFLVILIIYVICSMLFESMRLPFAVILMIPVSFIGVFLIFGLTDFTFDQGGFAAFVMLAGIVVNAGIYLLNAWQNNGHNYVKAFNHKIGAISLTVISTVLGLIPFLFDGPKEVFWFSFAVGTITGLVFSMLALVFVLPVYIGIGSTTNNNQKT